MNKITKGRVLCLVLFGLLGGLAGCCCLSWRPGCPHTILTQPQSQTVKKGTPVTFSVVAAPLPVFYQWRFNGSNIAGATSNSYTIASANFSHIGAYTVQVWGSPTNESQAAYLSVYDTVRLNEGTLGMPIGLFIGPSYTCPSGGTFQKGYVVTNANGTPAFLYGPNVPPTSQSGIFVNSSALTKIAVDTFSSDNGTADTGLRIKNNWSPYLSVCNDNSTGGTDPKQSRLDFTLGTVSGQDMHRLTVFYKSIPGVPPGGIVFINWNYHN